MANRIFNITASGGWQSVNLPQRTRFLSIQCVENRTMFYRWAKQSEAWTVKAGTIRNLSGDQLWPNELEVMATAGDTIQVEAATAMNGAIIQ